MSQTAAQRAAERRRRMMEASASRMALVTGKINTEQFVTTAEEKENISTIPEIPTNKDGVAMAIPDISTTALQDSTASRSTSSETDVSQPEALPASPISHPQSEQKTQIVLPESSALQSAQATGVTTPNHAQFNHQQQQQPKSTTNSLITESNLTLTRLILYLFLITVSFIDFPGNLVRKAIYNAPIHTICLISTLIELVTTFLLKRSTSHRRVNRQRSTSPHQSGDVDLTSKLQQFLESKSNILPYLSHSLDILVVLGRIYQVSCLWITVYVITALPSSL